MEVERNNEFVQKKVPIRRPRKACTICRGLKTRCLPDGENKDPKSRCSRKNSDNEGTSPVSGTSVNGAHIHRICSEGGVVQRAKWDGVSPYDPGSAPGMGDKGFLWNNQHRNGLFPVNNEGPSPPGLYPASNGSVDTVPYGSLDTNPSPLAAYGHLPGKVSPPFLTLDYLDPPLGMLGDSQGVMNGRARPDASTPDTFRAVYNDPIEVGYLTEPEARHLFHQFMTRVAPSSTFFDPQYHTLQRVRGSPTLLTAILYASALFLRPEISGPLHSLAENYIARKMHGGDYDLPLIQAILVLVYWKHPNDRTVYQKMGMAVRLVNELRLQKWYPSRPPPAAACEEEERRRADVERTVHRVIGHDIATSFALQLPPASSSTMPPADQVLAWAESYRHLDVPGDFFSAFTAGIWEAHSSFGGHPRLLMEGTPFKYTKEGFAAFSRRLDEHLSRFRNHPMLVQEPYAGLCQLMDNSAVLKVRTIGWLQGLSPTTTSSTIIALVEEFFGVIKRLAASGDLLFCSDMIISLVSLPGILLHLGRAHFQQDERQLCGSLIRQVADLAQSLASTPGGENTMVFIERFYRRLAQDFDRYLGKEVSSNVPLQAFTNYEWPGIGADLSPAVGDPLGTGSTQDGIEQQAEWTWTNMLNSIPAWDGGIVPQ